MLDLGHLLVGLRLDHPHLQLLLVVDAAAPQTLDLLRHLLQLVEHLTQLMIRLGQLLNEPLVLCLQVLGLLVVLPQQVLLLALVPGRRLLHPRLRLGQFLLQLPHFGAHVLLLLAE